MFRLRTSEKCEFKGKIRVKKENKLYVGLGNLIDEDGMKWNIHGVFFMGDPDWVQACPMGELHPYYHDTSTAHWGFVSQTWEPYEIEWV